MLRSISVSFTNLTAGMVSACGPWHSSLKRYNNMPGLSLPRRRSSRVKSDFMCTVTHTQWSLVDSRYLCLVWCSWVIFAISPNCTMHCFSHAPSGKAVRAWEDALCPINSIHLMHHRSPLCPILSALSAPSSLCSQRQPSDYPSNLPSVCPVLAFYFRHWHHSSLMVLICSLHVPNHLSTLWCTLPVNFLSIKALLWTASFLYPLISLNYHIFQCFLLNKFHCNFSVSYKILPYYVYYFCILISMW